MKRTKRRRLSRTKIFRKTNWKFEGCWSPRRYYLHFNGSRGWLADRIVSSERVYPGNRDWRRDLERGGLEVARRSRRSDVLGDEELISPARTTSIVVIIIKTGCIWKETKISVKAEFIAVWNDALERRAAHCRSETSSITDWWIDDSTERDL